MDCGFSRRIRLGRIGFLNVLPIYYPLEAGFVRHAFDLVSGPPAALNRLMAEGSLDLSVVSSVEVARHPERYLVLPDLSISCRGPVQSVLLLSRRPVEALEGTAVHVTNQSGTSIRLLKVLFRRLLGFREVHLKTVALSQALQNGERPEAFLAIGDEALRWAHRTDYPYAWDLGSVWTEWTGRPFVFALWVAQRRLFEHAPTVLEEAAACLRRAKAWGLDHLELVCHAAENQEILGFDELRSYYGHLHYDFGPDEREGLRYFFEHLAELGEIPAVPEIELSRPLCREA